MSCQGSGFDNRAMLAASMQQIFRYKQAYVGSLQPENIKQHWCPEHQTFMSK